MILDNINYPADVKNLSNEELQILTTEIRDFLITSVSKTGGHLSSNLGVIELSIVLHYIFNTPDDSIIWDVGHQAYTHKILTGRKDKMHTIRKLGGLSGFTNRSESEFDVFGAGHSSTSISSALGIAVANKIKNNQHKTIAVIGDGALTGGMSFEALNHAGDSASDILIIVNDNKMSISKNVGGLSKHLTKLMSGKIYNQMKNKSMQILEKTPSIKRFAQKSEEHFKGMFMPSSFFEELGLEYFGPIDGNNIEELSKILINIKNKNTPRVLHIITKKGSGLESAENDPCKFHGISPKTGVTNNNPSYSKVFGNWLLDNGNNKKLIAITPAMGAGSGMEVFSEKFADQYFDTGIAEQHSITFAGGLATQGFKPIVAIYSTFLQRGYDQLIHDIALQSLPVIFAIDRAGIVGNDGATHSGSFDLSFLLPIPNLIIMAPSCGNELYQMLNTAFTLDCPVCIRYPRGITTYEASDKILKVGVAKIKRRGHSLAILAFGNMLSAALVVGKKLDATVVDMRFAKPLDEKMLIEIAATHTNIITIEENSIISGVGACVAKILQDNNIVTNLQIMGLPDEWIKQGSQQELYDLYNLTADGIIQTYEKNS